jgi:hypothetical protein
MVEFAAACVLWMIISTAHIIITGAYFSLELKEEVRQLLSCVLDMVHVPLAMTR